jgi:hypothetical protein
VDHRKSLAFAGFRIALAKAEFADIASAIREQHQRPGKAASTQAIAAAFNLSPQLPASSTSCTGFRRNREIEILP